MTSPTTEVGRADLHLHTLHSDGTFSAEEVVERAIALGLSAISITDHDTVAGIPRAVEAAVCAVSPTGSGQVHGRTLRAAPPQSSGPTLRPSSGQASRPSLRPALEVIPGVELTSAFRGREIHILGYGINPQDPGLLDFLERMRLHRRDRIQAMIDRLKEHGIEVTLKEVCDIAGCGSLGRPHLAEVLRKRNVVGSFEEAFHRFIGDRAPCFVSTATLTVTEAVGAIRNAKGIAVVAHPYRIVQDDWFPELVQAGIRGVEVFHSDHTPSVSRRYLQLAKRHGLLTTGGSDCHGFRKSSGPLIGTVTIPVEWVERLKGGQTPC